MKNLATAIRALAAAPESMGPSLGGFDEAGSTPAGSTNPSADPEQRRIADLRECAHICRLIDEGILDCYNTGNSCANAIESRWPEVKS